MRTFKIKQYDEVNNIWLLEERILWIFWRFVSSGTKKKLQNFVDGVGGVIVNRKTQK